MKLNSWAFYSIHCVVRLACSCLCRGTLRVWWNFTNPFLGTRKLLKEVSTPKLILAGRREGKWKIWLNLVTQNALILRDFTGKQKGKDKREVCSHWPSPPLVVVALILSWGRTDMEEGGNNEIALKLNHFLFSFPHHSENFYMPPRERKHSIKKSSKSVYDSSQTFCEFSGKGWCEFQGGMMWVFRETFFYVFKVNNSICKTLYVFLQFL